MWAGIDAAALMRLLLLFGGMHVIGSVGLSGTLQRWLPGRGLC